MPDSSSSSAQARTASVGADAAEQRTGRSDASLQDVAAEYYKKLTQTAAALTVEANHLYRDTEDYVRQHPAPFLGLAFLGGVLLGLLSARD